jgi:hypothetical protein
LQGARQRSEDKAWQRRDVEGFAMKKSWLKDTSEYERRQMAAANEITTTDADIEDAAEWIARQELLASDEMLMEETVRYEEMALDAMLADMQQGKQQTQLDYLMDEEDDEFDRLLVGLVDPQSTQPASATDVMMDD